MRRDRRRQLGAGRLVILEVATNRASVDWYYADAEGGPASPDKLAHLVEHLETRAWDVHGADLAVLLDDELLLDIEETYYGLRRTTHDHSCVTPDWPSRLATIEHELRRRLTPTRGRRRLVHR